MGLVFSISNFFIKESSLANKWMSFSYSNSALADKAWSEKQRNFIVTKCIKFQFYIRYYFLLFFSPVNVFIGFNKITYRKHLIKAAKRNPLIVFTPASEHFSDLVSDSCQLHIFFQCFVMIISSQDLGWHFVSLRLNSDSHFVALFGLCIHYWLFHGKLVLCLYSWYKWFLGVKNIPLLRTFRYQLGLGVK